MISYHIISSNKIINQQPSNAQRRKNSVVVRHQADRQQHFSVVQSQHLNIKNMHQTTSIKQQASNNKPFIPLLSTSQDEARWVVRVWVRVIGSGGGGGGCCQRLRHGQPQHLALVLVQRLGSVGGTHYAHPLLLFLLLLLLLHSGLSGLFPLCSQSLSCFLQLKTIHAVDTCIIGHEEEVRAVHGEGPPLAAQVQRGTHVDHIALAMPQRDHRAGTTCGGGGGGGFIRREGFFRTRGGGGG